jgi:heavy metal efflux system protein
LTQGYKVSDIENVVLSQENGVPVTIKESVRYRWAIRPRLGILGRDQNDDVVGAIVVQGRTEKAADMVPKVKSAIDALNHDGSLQRPPRCLLLNRRSE